MEAPGASPGIEPLIPLLMVPAWDHNWWLVAAVAGTFSVTTVVTMTGAAALGTLGLQLPMLQGVERYANLLAGAAIAGSGLAVKLLGI